MTSEDYDTAVCPACGEEPYSGSHNGTRCYKCRMPKSSCPWAKQPLARTKDELRRVNCELSDWTPPIYKVHTRTLESACEHMDLGEHVSWMLGEAADESDYPMQVSVTIEIQEQ